MSILLELLSSLISRPFCVLRVIEVGCHKISNHQQKPSQETAVTQSQRTSSLIAIRDRLHIAAALLSFRNSVDRPSAHRLVLASRFEGRRFGAR